MEKLKNFLRNLLKKIITFCFVLAFIGAFSYGLWAGRLSMAPEIGAKLKIKSKAVSQVLRDAAEEANLPASLVQAIARQESSLDASNTVVSDKSAYGIMQVTAIHVGTTCPWLKHWSDLLGRSDTAIENNIKCGIAVLWDCLETRRDIKQALACYYAGARYDQKGPRVKAEALTYASQVINRFEAEKFALLNKQLKGNS